MRLSFFNTKHICASACGPPCECGSYSSHCQHFAGDATERVGWDLGDVGLINNFPAKEDGERAGNEVVL